MIDDPIFLVVRSDLAGAPIAKVDQVARDAGLSRGTLCKLRDGWTDVNMRTLRKLRAYYLREQQQAPGGAWDGAERRQQAQ